MAHNTAAAQEHDLTRSRGITSMRTALSVTRYSGTASRNTYMAANLYDVSPLSGETQRDSTFRSGHALPNRAATPAITQRRSIIQSDAITHGGEAPTESNGAAPLSTTEQDEAAAPYSTRSGGDIKRGLTVRRDETTRNYTRLSRSGPIVSDFITTGPSGKAPSHEIQRGGKTGQGWAAKPNYSLWGGKTRT